jgi:hypothetical protein
VLVTKPRLSRLLPGVILTTPVSPVALAEQEHGRGD